MKTFNLNFQISPVLLNYRRVAEVWLDDHAEYLYRREPILRHHSAGDLTAQKKFRDTHKCQSFQVIYILSPKIAKVLSLT